MILKVFVCVGLPGSGKSTWAKKKVKETSSRNPKTIIVNKDAIRTMIHGTYRYDYQYKDLVKALRYSILNTLVCHGYNIIIDETNINREERVRLIYDLHSIAHKWDRVTLKIIGVWFTENNRNLEFCMRSPKGQKKSIWSMVICTMKQDFEKPIKSEGFDEIVKRDIYGKAVHTSRKA